MESVLSIGTVSSSHTYGNIIEMVKEDILSKFSSNYFKYKHVSTELASRQIRKYTRNTLYEFRKQEKPLIAIRPVIELGDDDIPFANTLLTTNVMGNQHSMSKSSLQPFIKDFDNRYELRYRLNRDRLSFDVLIQNSTLISQLDLAKSIQNIIGFNIPSNKHTSLESVIPFPLIEYISKLINIDIKNGYPSSIPVMVKYLQDHASYPITYKIRNSTSTSEFFMYYESPVLITYSDFNIDDGSKKEMVDDIYSINFKVTVEFNHPGAFVLIGNNNPLFTKIEIDVSSADDTNNIFPLYTMNTILSDEIRTYDNFKLYTSTIFSTDIELKDKIDYLDLYSVIEPVYIPIIKKYNISNYNNEILFKYKLYKNSILLKEGIDYNIDYNEMRLNIIKSDPEYTYRIFVYMNHLKIQDELLTLNENIKNDKTYNFINK